MASLADVLASDPKPSWQESVALVQAIAAQLGADPVPAAEDLLLEEDGTLTFGFAGESSRPQVADLAGLLERLLAGVPAPQSLLDLVHENARPEPAHATVAGFCRALQFYERPNRAADLAAVGGRVAGVQPRAEPTPEPAASVPEPIRPEPEKPTTTVTSSPAIRALRGIRFSPGELAVGATAVVLIAVFALAGALLGSRPPSDSGRRLASAASSPVEATTAPAEPSTTTDEPSGVGSSGRTGPDRDGRERPSARRRVARAPQGAPHKPARARAAQAPRPVSGARAASPLLTLPRPSVQFPVVAWNAIPPDPRVYSADDAGVTPPRMLRQLLPDVAPQAASGYLDVVVDARGYVETVKLISAATRLEDFGLIAAAKAWKFSPALVAGRPVKCRLRVPIPIDGPPE